MIRVKRVYDAPAPDDGTRFLVDRLWPRGVSRGTLQISAWLKDAAPSHALRRWFGHDATRWQEFQERYFAELDSRPQAWQPILEAARCGTVTLVYSARDADHNQAVALKSYLEQQLLRKGNNGAS